MKISKVFAAVIGGTARPYILRDREQNRNFLPLFTTRLAFGLFKQNCPPGTTLELVEYDNIGAFVSRAGPTLKLALPQGLEWISIDHPGPTLAHPAVVHIKVADILALDPGFTELEVK